jgi:hypothetical protein
MPCHGGDKGWLDIIPDKVWPADNSTPMDTTDSAGSVAGDWLPPPRFPPPMASPRFNWLCGTGQDWSLAEAMTGVCWKY